MKLFGGMQSKRRADYLDTQETDENEAVYGAEEPEAEETEEYTREAAGAEEDEYGGGDDDTDGEEYDGGDEEAGGDEETDENGRTPEEREEIENIIADYQKRKKRRRIIIFSVLAALIAGGAIWYGATVKPPDIKEPVKTPRPTVTGSPDNTVIPTDGGEVNQDEDGEAPDTVSAGAKTRKDGVRTFLVLGLEQSFANTDTIMLGMIDTNEHKVNIVSIPRDTCVNVPYENKKINGVYAYSGGIDGVINALADVTGYEVDSYVKVDINAFVALVDTIGGVGFDIPYNMNYDDPTQNLHIHFSKGYAELSGSEAVKVVRWRQNNDGSNYGDIVRINTQQNFLKTVAKKCLSLTNLATKLKDYADIFKNYVDTDLTTGNIVWYGQQFLKMSMDDISFYTIPSNYYDSIKGFSYGTIWVDDWLEMLNENFNPYNEAIEKSDVSIISRNSSGELYSTSGSISGGYGSFLDYNEFMRKYYGSGADENTEEPTDETPNTGEPGDETPDTGAPTGDTPSPSVSDGDTAEPTGDTPSTEEPAGSTTEQSDPTPDTSAPSAPSVPSDPAPDAPPPAAPVPEAPQPNMQTGGN